MRFDISRVCPLQCTNVFYNSGTVKATDVVFIVLIRRTAMVIRIRIQPAPNIVLSGSGEVCGVAGLHCGPLDEATIRYASQRRICCVQFRRYRVWNSICLLLLRVSCIRWFQSFSH